MAHSMSKDPGKSKVGGEEKKKGRFDHAVTKEQINPNNKTTPTDSY